VPIIDVVKMDFLAGELVKKFGGVNKNELSTWTQMIVNESQEALVYIEGAMDGPFGPGRHVLETKNLPVVGKVLNLPFGRSPFTAEVWFINKVMTLDVMWTTEKPIKLNDPQHNLIVPVLASGQFGIQVQDSKKFLVKIVGTLSSFDVPDLKRYFNGMILAVAKTILAKEIIEKRISVLHIATKLIELSDSIKLELLLRLQEFGLGLSSFYLDSIDVEENDPSIETLRKALAKKAEMDIMGYSYMQERSMDVMQSAASNEGGASTQSSLLGAGLGLGMGAGLGGNMGNAMGQISNQLEVNTRDLDKEKVPLDIINLLKQLAELRQAGILTDEEFILEKQKLLNLNRGVK